MIFKTGFSGLKLDQSFANLLAAVSCWEMQCENSIDYLRSMNLKNDFKIIKLYSDMF